VLVALWPPLSQRLSSPSSTAASSRRTGNSRAGKSSKALFYFAVQNPHPSPKAFPAFVTSMPVISPPKSSRPSALLSHTLHPTTSNGRPYIRRCERRWRRLGQYFPPVCICQTIVQCTNQSTLGVQEAISRGTMVYPLRRFLLAQIRRLPRCGARSREHTKQARLPLRRPGESARHR
jgi:hypothetical protein